MAENKYLKFLDATTIQRATEEYNLVRIGAVKGILMEPIKYQMQGNWEPLIDPNMFGPAVATVQKAAQITGNLVGQTGIFSERFYVGGSYATFNINMRIVDWSGDGSPLAFTKVLFSYVVPSGGEYDSDSIRNNFNAQFVDNKKTGLDGVVEKAGDTLKLLGKEVLNAIAKAPPEVPVSLGNYLMFGAMIVMNVGATYSLEMTPSGPLYADVDVEVGAKRLTTTGSLGILTDHPKRPRVTTQGQ